MIKKTPSRSWYSNALAVLVLLLGLLTASSAKASTEADYWAQLKGTWDIANKVAGGCKQAYDAEQFAVKIAQWIGLMATPLSLADVKAEMERIAAYQDAQHKNDDLKEADTQKNVAIDMLNQNPGVQKASPVGAAIQAAIIAALADALAPQGQCTGLPVFQTLHYGDSSPQAYDWRAGMAEALTVVAARLLVMAALDPNFKTTNLSLYQPELVATRNCLTEHLNTIHPPKPFSFCQPTSSCNGFGCGCGDLQCWDQRSWPLWPTTHLSAPFASRCGTYVFSGSYSGFRDFDGAQAVASAKIDHDDLPIVFQLQRLIDTLGAILSGQADLAATNQHIPFGANPQLCLSLTSAGSILLGRCSTGTSVNWTYDRGTGSIANVSTGACLATQGNPPNALVMAPCSPDASDETQRWSWNPDTGRIKNPSGYVLTVNADIPEVGMTVTVQPESAWILHEQVWTRGDSSTCTGAICPLSMSAAWNQGTISGTSQRFPIDLNVFTYREGSGFMDMQGPIAVHGPSFVALTNPPLPTLGGISASSFSINAFTTMPVGLLIGGGFLNLLVGGQIYGTSIVDPSVVQTISSSVTFPGKSQQQTTIPTQPNPINFEMAFVRLQRLSRDLRFLSTNGSMTYSGQPGWATLKLGCATGANLQVFGVPASMLSGTTLIQFNNCPSGSTILVNVSGASVSISNAQITGVPSVNRTIWNFYEATSLGTSSVQFLGSILAPSADTHFTWGVVDGTLAAWSTESSGEFHFYPFHENVIMPGY